MTPELLAEELFVSDADLVLWCAKLLPERSQLFVQYGTSSPNVMCSLCGELMPVRVEHVLNKLIHAIPEFTHHLRERHHAEAASSRRKRLGYRT